MPDHEPILLDVAIVGAGVAGLAAAEALKAYKASAPSAGDPPASTTQPRRDRPLSYRLFERASVPGGRIASRPLRGDGDASAPSFTAPHALDTTAQFFTARSPELQRLVETWREPHGVHAWFEKPDERGGTEAGWASRQGLGMLMAHWAVQHEVSCGAALTGLQAQRSPAGEALWSLELSRAVFGGPQRARARGVIVTAPWPDAEPLVQAWIPGLAPEVQAKLADLRYAPCLVLELEIAGPSGMAPPGLLFMPHPDVVCVADPAGKGMGSRSPNQGWVMLMTPEFSAAHWSDDEAALVPRLIDLAKAWLGQARILRADLGRWPHARVTQAFGAPCLALPSPAPLLVCGDGFAGPRFEGAFTSGWQAGLTIARLLALAAT